MMKKEIRLSGSGGQGMILAGVILADAAIRAGYYAIQTQSYGPEARGGASRAEVVLSDQPIDYPKVTLPDIFLALTPEAYEKYCHTVHSNGLIIVEQSITSSSCTIETLRLPILATARNTGKEITANMVALGTLAALLGNFLKKGYFESAVNERVPSGTAEVNLLAFQNGYAMIQSYNRL